MEYIDELARWSCVQCGYHSQNRAMVLRHVLAKHLAATFQCIYCSKKFTQDSNRKQHLKKEHNVNLPSKAIREMALKRGLER